MRPHRKRGKGLSPVALAWIPVLAGCDRPADVESPEEAPFVERDSAGVLVATTSGAKARAPIGWVVDTVPDYQVGEMDGEDPYLFSWVEGARQLADGRVAVLDRGSCELRFFGSDGVFLNRAGGRGEGPGEFRDDCYWVPSLVEDSLFVYDGVQLSSFDERGRFGHRARLSWRGARVERVHGAGRRSVLIAAEFSSVALEGLPRDPSTADFALLERDGLAPVWEGFFQGMQHYAAFGSMFRYRLPFDIVPVAVLGPDGLFLTLGEDRGPEILEYDGSGGLRRIIRLAEPGAAPSADDLPSLVEFQLHHLPAPDTLRARILERERQLYAELPLPEIMPVFLRLLIDDVGSLWAELYRFDVRQPTRWLVFGPDGEGLGSVDMPPGLAVRQIGRDFVVGVWRDEDGVEYVRRHAVAGRR